MDTQLVMSKDEIDEMREKAREVKETGIPSKELPQTKYEIRVQEHQNETKNVENVDITDYIESSDIKHLNNNVCLPQLPNDSEIDKQIESNLQLDDIVLAEFLQCDQNEFVLQWSLDESLFED